MPKRKRHNIVDVVYAGADYSRGSDDWKRGLRRQGDLYIIPALHGFGLKYWDEVESHHIAQMVKAWEREGRLSPATMRHIIQVVWRAQDYAAEILGMERKLQISGRVLPPLVKAPIRYLTFEQLATCCRVALSPGIRPPKKHGAAKALELGRLVLLTCGLLGLRTMEFARLKPDCLTSDNILTVGWDCQHGLLIGKNENAARSIPIPDFLGDELRSYWSHRGSWTSNRNNLGVRTTTVFQWAAALADDPSIRLVTQRHLRKTLSNELVESVPRHFLEAYCGWAFSGVMLNNYVQLRPHPRDTQHVRAAAIDRLRNKVLRPLESKLVGLDFGRGVPYPAQPAQDNNQGVQS